MKKSVLKSLVALSLLGASVSHAANIVWLTPTDVTGNVTDIVTTGTYFDSATFSNIDLTMNGVTFNRSNSSTGNTFAGSGITFAGSPTKYTGFVPPSSFDATYKNFLGSAAYVYGSFNISLTNLNVGSDYLVQLWTPYWDENNYQMSFSGGANTSSLLVTGYNPIGAGARKAQFVVGSFTADSNTQTITSTPTNFYSLVSGLQVRSLPAVSAVPEPETYAMFMAGLGLMGFVARRRKV